jgi:protein-tyrosine phosphatase
MATKVLMVCLGNICRSPLAEGIMSSLVDSSKVYVDSAGTAGYHVGSLPDPRSIAVAQKNGLDITNQRCRKLRAIDFEHFDHIYVMDQSNYQDALAHADTEEKRHKLELLLVAGNQETVEVPDPYYGGDSGFDYVYDLVQDACSRIASDKDWL